MEGMASEITSSDFSIASLELLEYLSRLHACKVSGSRPVPVWKCDVVDHKPAHGRGCKYQLATALALHPKDVCCREHFQQVQVFGQSVDDHEKKPMQNEGQSKWDQRLWKSCTEAVARVHERVFDNTQTDLCHAEAQLQDGSFDGREQIQWFFWWQVCNTALPWLPAHGPSSMPLAWTLCPGGWPSRDVHHFSEITCTSAHHCSQWLHFTSIDLVLCWRRLHECLQGPMCSMLFWCPTCICPIKDGRAFSLGHALPAVCNAMKKGCCLSILGLEVFCFGVISGQGLILGLLLQVFFPCLLCTFQNTSEELT